ncbi:ketodeoxygluconokinase [[Pantoea] beijingensis]|uniref:2-dehydro-3-deoxygluconokinase n=1 Tax=[Pantoea] beijingensis TaxID=1324864 RepID=A0A443IE39_9GAMM|nr:sugar kinase [[Pantoea] beijingensis]RWR02286.1 ketodeoxygluconokinase [[Pantoea] beijingensis]
MTPKNIAVIGECMIELSQQNNGLSQGFGGDTLNTSVYIARQVPAAQLNVQYVTALGTDTFSDQMLAAWQHEGVQTDLIQRMDNKLPGLYVIETDAHGERTFYYWRNEAAARFWLESEQAEEICQQLSRFDYLYLSGISLAILSPQSREKLMALLAACRRNGGKVIFDNNYRPRLWQNREETQQAYLTMLASTNIAFLTLDDETLLWGENSLDNVIARTQAAGVEEIVIKRGAEPCLVAVGQAPRIEVPAITLSKEKVIDTTAAGDSFSAGYLAVRLTGGSVEDAAARGHLVASTVIQHRGAIIPSSAMPK